MWFVHYMRWIMLASGALTATIGAGYDHPDAALQANFRRDGQRLSGAPCGPQLGNAHRLCRRNADLRRLQSASTLSRADRRGREQGYLIALVLSEGTRYVSHQAGVAVAIDSVMVVLFGWYLAAARSAGARARTTPTRLSV